MNGLHLLQLLTISCALPLLCLCQALNQSMNLLDNLLTNYDRRVRPTLNQAIPTYVYLNLNLLNIEDFDEVSGKFSVTGVLFIFWEDEKLVWNPEDYGGIESQLLPIKDVWYPILIQVYPFGKYEDFVDEWMTVRIYHTGLAIFIPGAVFKSSCNVDVTYYPFDIQTCSLIFIPWAYSLEEIKVNVTEPYVARDYFIEHGEWDIIHNTSTTSDTVENSVQFTFKLQRKPLFCVVNIILPIVLMSFLNILIFALPPQSGERISYGVTVLLATAVFLTIVGDILPKTSKPMAVLSYFLIINLTMSALMCISAIMNLRVYFKEDAEPFTYWALFIIRITKCACKRSNPNPNPTNESGVKYQLDGNDIQTRQLPNASIISKVNECKDLTWRDVSKAIDKLCLIVFFFVIAANTATFVFVATLGPK